MSSDAASKQWYYLAPVSPSPETPDSTPTPSTSAQQVGPLTWEEIIEAARRGDLRPDSLVWGPSLATWTRADSIPGLFAPVVPTAASLSSPVQAGYPGAVPARKRSLLLPILIPVIALVVVGAGLGTYFGFFYDRGKETAVTTSTSIAGTVPTTEPEGSGGKLGVADYQPPQPDKIVEVPGWGPVPVNRVGVVLAEGRSRRDAQKLAEDLGGTIVGAVEFINAYEIEIAATTEADLKAALDQAKKSEGVELAFPDLPIVRFTEIWGVRQSPLNDPVYAEGRDAGLKLIGAPQAWTYIRSCGLPLSEVHVGVVDDGLYRGNGEYDEVNVYFPDPNAGELSEPERPHGSHGTMVAGQIAADPSDGGMTGIASPALGNLLTLSMINNFDAYYSDRTVPSGDPNDPTIVTGRDGVARSFGSLVAITRAVEAGAKIINCSWGFDPGYLLKLYKKEQNGEVPPGTYSAAYAVAEEKAAAYRRFFERMSTEHPDVLFVCAAGNTGFPGQGNLEFPAGYPLPNLITVGNVNNDGTTATSSSRVNTQPGQEFEITLAAPGDQAIKGVDRDGKPIMVGYVEESGQAQLGGGTSAASPQVAAAAALLLALDPDLTAQEIKQILSETARPGPQEVGGKIVAVDQAVLRLINERRQDQGLPPVTGEDLEKAGVIDAVAISQDEPNTWTVKAIVEALPSASGAEITISATTGVKITGELAQKITAPGEIVWTPVVVPNETAEITVTRSDTGAASVIRFQVIDLNGTWTGTLVFTDIQLSPEAQAELEQMAENPPEELEGCDLSSIGAILEQLKGKPCPLTLDITADEGGTGSASLYIDFSPLGESAEPLEAPGIPITWSGSSFTLSSSNNGGTITISGQASIVGEDEVLSGTLTLAAVQEGKTVYTIVGQWSATKQ